MVALQLKMRSKEVVPVPRRIGKQRKQAGLLPGTLVYAGGKRVERVPITLINYDKTHFHEKETGTIEKYFPFRDESTVAWINIDGIHDVELLEKLGEHFEQGADYLAYAFLDITVDNYFPILERIGDRVDRSSVSRGRIRWCGA